jgi:hypothetical protein
MKTLKTLAASLLTIVSLSAFAADGEKSEKLKINYTLNTFVDAMANGQMEDLGDILDDQMKFTVVRSEKVINYSKSQLLNSLKQSENVVQNCDTDYDVEKINSSQALVKVIMKYEGFTKINYINLDNTKTGWKITSISSSYSK